MSGALIDFRSARRLKKGYDGANGSKASIRYNGRIYMLKFPSTPVRNPRVHYSASCFSEYLGCHIFQTLGIRAQHTLLGTSVNFHGSESIVVACEDFEQDGRKFFSFTAAKNSLLDSSHSGRGTELRDMLFTMRHQLDMDPDELQRFFWDMFVVDALIANWDRHNGNWGFLYDQTTDSVELAPVFDCGSSLYPGLPEEEIRTVLDDPAEIDVRIYERPDSALRLGSRRLSYFDFIAGLQNEDCSQAVRRISRRLDMDRIRQIIDEMPAASDLRKEFYWTILKARKERILDAALQRMHMVDKGPKTPHPVS